MEKVIESFYDKNGKYFETIKKSEDYTINRGSDGRNFIEVHNVGGNKEVVTFITNMDPIEKFNKVAEGDLLNETIEKINNIIFKINAERERIYGNNEGINMRKGMSGESLKMVTRPTLSTLEIIKSLKLVLHSIENGSPNEELVKDKLDMIDKLFELGSCPTKEEVKEIIKDSISVTRKKPKKRGRKNTQ